MSILIITTVLVVTSGWPAPDPHCMNIPPQLANIPSVLSVAEAPYADAQRTNRQICTNLAGQSGTYQFLQNRFLSVEQNYK